MTNQTGVQPIFILPEGTMRTTGKDAQMRNITAAKAVGETVRSTLGPKGMDKMLVDTIGDVTITNDGATILTQMEIEHPAAKMIVEVAKTQDDEVGDGTTTAAVLASELLKKAEGLLEQDIHPTMIIRGYRMAKLKSLELLEVISHKISASDMDELQKIATTAMTGKGSDTSKGYLSKMAVDAIKSIPEPPHKDDIKIEKKHGGSIDDTELIKGIVIDKEISHVNMPKAIKDAKIALLDCALEVKNTETNSEIRITSPDQLQAFLDQESRMLKEMVKKVVASGCNVVFCQKGIDDLAQHYLAKEGIAASRRVKKSDMENLSKATGAVIISNVDELSKSELGYAGIVEEKKIGGEQMVFVRDCKNPKSVSILVRGSTEHVVDEVKRAMDDAVLGLISSLEVGRVVYGGGSVEMEIARRISEYSETIGGREQLAINAFAEAIEIIPRTLSESTGKDPIDILVDLRSKHENGGVTYGVDVMNGAVEDMKKLGVVEPLKIKTQALKSACEACEMILRIDDVITAKSSGSMPGGGMPHGMPPGGMGDME